MVRYTRLLFFPYFRRMIAYIRGKFIRKTPSQVIVDVNGLGYELQISLNTFSEIQHLEEGSLFTYFHVREDAQILYGFASEEEKNIFTLLISVSGVGAATARMMISSMLPQEIIRAIGSGDAKKLEGVKGIGRKSAERIVLELKDKIVKLPSGSSVQNNTAGTYNTLEADALNALIALGISKQAGELAIQRVMKIPGKDKIEDIIKEALKTL